MSNIWVIRDGVVNVYDTRILTEASLEPWFELYPNFHPRELDSDDFTVRLSKRSLDGLERLRTELDKPMRLTSAWRCPSHNKRVGGAKKSRHSAQAPFFAGEAYDIVIESGAQGARIESIARAIGFNGIGRYQSRGFIHIDMRPKAATWGRKWR